MIDFDSELSEMVADKNLMNSYKLYFLKVLIINASKEKKKFGFCKRYSLSFYKKLMYITCKNYIKIWKERIG